MQYTCALHFLHCMLNLFRIFINFFNLKSVYINISNLCLNNQYQYSVSNIRRIKRNHEFLNNCQKKIPQNPLNQKNQQLVLANLHKANEHNISFPITNTTYTPNGKY